MDRAPTFPSHVDIDLTSKCNLRCTFCHLTYFDAHAPQQINLAEFKRFLGDALPRLRSITLFGKYEPLICRDFIPIFELCHDHGIETYFSTNAVFLDEAAATAIAGRLTFLTVSVTGFDRESYKRHMGSDKFETVEANLERLVAEKRRLGTHLPRLRLSTVGMLDTIDDLPRAIDFAARFDMSEGIQLTSLIAHHPSMVSQMPLNDPQHWRDATTAALAIAAERGVRLVLQSGAMEDNAAATSDLGHKPCYLPWQRLSIQPNGDVYPCPAAYEPVGSLEMESLEDIWTGERLAGFRQGVNDVAHMNEDCRNCTHCRHKTVARPAGNDFSNAPRYITRMQRRDKPARGPS